MSVLSTCFPDIWWQKSTFFRNMNTSLLLTEDLISTTIVRSPLMIISISISAGRPNTIPFVSDSIKFCTVYPVPASISARPFQNDFSESISHLLPSPPVLKSIVSDKCFIDRFVSF